MTLLTYKGINDGNSTFFWYAGKTKNKKLVDCEKDSFEDIKNKWGSTLLTENDFEEKSFVIDKFVRYLKEFKNI